MSKFILFIVVFVGIQKANAQDTLGLKKIDSVVNIIEKGKWNFQTDSLLKRDTIMNIMFMETDFHLSHYFDDSNCLKKLVWYNRVKGKKQGDESEITTTSIFYYNANKLIKVDDTAIENGKTGHIETYYNNDKVLYCSVNRERTEERSFLLLGLSKTFLKQFQDSKKKPA
jgi:hypothetical protein